VTDSDATPSVRERIAERGAALSRRDALKGVAAGVLGLGGFRAADNVLLGYGVLVGTNLHDQDLGALAHERFAPSRTEVPAGDGRVLYTEGDVWYGEGEEWLARAPATADALPEAREIDAEYGLDGVFARMVELGGLAAEGDLTFEFVGFEDFFDRYAGADGPDPLATELFRGTYADVPEERVEAFAEADPRDVESLLRGMKEGFRDHSGYDIQRYLAGSVEDNVIMGAADLRGPFTSETAFEALLAGENSGLFCYEFANRAVEAVQAVPAASQTVPALAGIVTDERHKHVFSSLATVVPTDDGFVVPTTFFDYTHSTLNDDLSVRWLLGEGLAAYDRRHRATELFWGTYVIGA